MCNAKHMIYCIYIIGKNMEQSPYVDYPYKSIIMWSFDVVFDTDLNRLFNKRSLCLWFETNWRSCDAAVVG